MLWCAGCAHRVALETSPPGANVRIDDETVAATPTEIVVHWAPWHPRLRAEVRMLGYREMDVKLGRGFVWDWIGDVVTLRFGRLSGKTTRSEIDLLLVPVHEGAGTWTSEDVTGK
jgi:hypothetical protein